MPDSGTTTKQTHGKPSDPTNGAPVGGMRSVASCAEPAVWPRSAMLGLLGLVLLGWLLLGWNLSKPITLYVDDIVLLNNLIDADVAELAEPMEGNQVAPYGFVFAIWSVVGLFGLGLTSVKMVAFVSAVVSVPVFALLVRRVCAPLPGLLLVVGFVGSGQWLLQACRVKPYTLDVLLALLGLWAGLWLLDRRCGWREAAALSVLAAVGVWFSIAFYIVLAGVGVVLLGTRLVRARRAELGWLLVAAGVGLVSGLVHFFLVLRGQIEAADAGDFMTSFWRGGFLPLPWERPEGLARALSEAVSDASGLALPGLVLGLAGLGAGVMVARRDARVAVLLAPLGVAIALSMAGVYPMADRLALYLGPSVLLLVAAGWQGLRQGVPGRAGYVLMLLAAAAVLSGPVQRRGVASFDDDAVPVFRYVNDHLGPDQHVYLFYGAEIPYDFYVEHIDPSLAFPADRLTRGGRHRDDALLYSDDVRALRSEREVWFVFSHANAHGGIDEASYFKLLMDRYGERVAEHRGWGAVAILWRPDAAEAASIEAVQPAPDPQPESQP